MSPKCVCVGSGLLAALLVVSSLLARDKPGEPTPEQLQQAKDAFAVLGAAYKQVDAVAKQSGHWFIMPFKTEDADLKKVPDLPFAFGLSLNSTQVTDAGLKSLKNLKNLTSLDIVQTRVTDAGLK